MRRPDLEARCENCASLCCVAIYFERSADFAYTKAAGERCKNLRGDGRCGIHAELAEQGFNGCKQFDCYGAGPKATALAAGEERQKVFRVLTKLYDLIWMLTEAAKICPADGLRRELEAGAAALDALVAGGTGAILAADAQKERAVALALLRRVGPTLSDTARGPRR